MENKPVWLFNENKLIGVDYLSRDIAGEYESQHNFRNFKEEADKIFDDLQLSPESTILDIGCGTGGLSIQFAQRCKHVYSVDVPNILTILQTSDLEKNEIQLSCYLQKVLRRQGR